jgi:hypothetical protein
MMSVTDTTEFRPGEMLQMVRIEGDSLVKRQVRFIEQMGAEQAIIGFGQDYRDGSLARHTCHMSELHRVTAPSFLPGIAEQFKPPTPPTTEQVATRLRTARVSLCAAHERAKAARDTVASAQQVADRAREQVASTRAQLAEQTLADQRDAEAFADSIRRGEAPPPHKNRVDREALRSRVAVAEQAEASFASELALANTNLADALGNVRKLAAAVLGALVEREAESLRVLEVQAAKFRKELQAAAAFWPDASIGALKLSPAAGQLLEAEPNYGETSAIRFASQEGRIAPWRSLYDQLVSGNADADFKLEE